MNMKKWSIAFIAVFLLVVLTLTFYMPSIWTSSLFSKDRVNLVVNGVIIKGYEEPIVENGEILLPISVVKDFVDNKVLWDSSQNKVIFTTADKVVYLRTDKLNAMVNSKPVELNIPVRLVQDKPYIPIGFLSDIFFIDINWIESNKVVILDHRVEEEMTAWVINKKAHIRVKPDVRSHKASKKLLQGQKLRVFSQTGDWFLTRTETGLIGYVEKKHVKTEVVKTDKQLASYNPTEVWKPETGKINLVWEYVHKKSPDTSKLKTINGLDVVSPTWFEVKDKEGTVENKADHKYVEWAHSNGYKVWGLITNSFNKDLTHAILNDSDVRESIIKQMLIYAELYKLDGINIDFENIYEKDRDMLTQFVREMVPLFREQGLVVSMDVTFISNSGTWSKCYDRKALSEVLDYVAVMAYDQHWAASPVSGSVAQYSWVEKNLIRVLQEIPREKLLLGIPFYTREWKEEKVDGKIKVTSRALTMSSAKKVVEEKKAKVTWDEASGQYYAEYTEKGVRYRIWIEDEKSLNLKTSLALKHDLAGVAAWRRGFETENIWKVLSSNMKDKKSYAQWQNDNKLGYKEQE